jgi:predicted deacylase
MSGTVEPPRTFHYEGQPGPHLLITAGVHGDEFESISAVQRLIDLFEKSDPSVAELRGEITLVPVVNESAFRRGHRCGDDGLDLARTCPGRINGTATEQTAHHLSELIRDADFYIDLHTGGTEMAVFPLAGYTLHPNAEVLETQRQMANAFNLPFIWGTAANLDGRSLSVARDANVPAIYCEYLGSATSDPACVSAYVNGCLNVMGDIGMLSRELPMTRVEHMVEDDTPGSGHMQVCHPSPVTGLFEPHVRLGDHVGQGQTIGIVRELDSTTTHSVEADKAGMVIVLRTVPRVCEDESVGVLVELKMNRT